MNSAPRFHNASSRLTKAVRLGLAALGPWCLASSALSTPVNPVVMLGTGSFNQIGNVLTVTNSNGAIINWDKFSIKAGETTHFAQPSASSTVLNRVLNDPTAIYGTLSSNGRVWLVNPAGIMVGPGGRIDTAGFVASTLNISNDNFLAGRKLFDQTPGAGNVINQGEIKTPAGGSVYLIGSNVANESIISTPQGETILAAGATVSLVDSATPGVKVDITGAAGNATNLGQITAEAGRIGIAGVIVRNSGSLNASSVVEEGGRIFLKASRDAYVDGNGRITTTGTTGGKVEVLGERVAVMDQAGIDASGTHGGGRIMVGGDYQGKNPEVANAEVSYLGKDAVLKADATEVGAGGTVVIWANDTTRAYGTISARGGANGGNGGLVETSGKGKLTIVGARVDTLAPMGQTGDWLLDATDISIVSGGQAQFTGDAFVPQGNSTITVGDTTGLLTSGSLDIQYGYATLGTGNITMYGGSISLSGQAGILPPPVVVSGSASFSQAGGVLSVTSSNGAVIDWDKFSIQPGGTIHFQQASTSSVVLNRVLGDPKTIYGKLSSNGKVWLVNPAGIMVGPGGRIDVVNHVAKTLNVNNNIDFHAARLQPINDLPFRNVFNQSRISTPVGGGVYVVGKERNAAVPGGPLVPGAIVSLIDSATPGVKVDLVGAKGGGMAVGDITAAAVRVGIAGVLVRNHGTLGASIGK